MNAASLRVSGSASTSNIVSEPRGATLWGSGIRFHSSVNRLVLLGKPLRSQLVGWCTFRALPEYCRRTKSSKKSCGLVELQITLALRKAFSSLVNADGKNKRFRGHKIVAPAWAERLGPDCIRLIVRELGG